MLFKIFHISILCCILFSFQIHATDPVFPEIESLWERKFNKFASLDIKEWPARWVELQNVYLENKFWDFVFQKHNNLSINKIEFLYKSGFSLYANQFSTEVCQNLVERGMLYFSQISYLLILENDMPLKILQHKHLWDHPYPWGLTSLTQKNHIYACQSYRIFLEQKNQQKENDILSYSLLLNYMSRFFKAFKEDWSRALLVTKLLAVPYASLAEYLREKYIDKAIRQSFKGNNSLNLDQHLSHLTQHHYFKLSQPILYESQCFILGLFNKHLLALEESSSSFSDILSTLKKIYNKSFLKERKKGGEDLELSEFLKIRYQFIALLFQLKKNNWDKDDAFNAHIFMEPKGFSRHFPLIPVDLPEDHPNNLMPIMPWDVKDKLPPPHKVIYNHTGLIEETKIVLKHIQQGNVLKLKSDSLSYPLGYNIYLPNQPTALVIEIYGGYAKGDPDNLYLPLNLYEENLLQNIIPFLSHNIAFMTTNLIDVTVNTKIQWEMSLETHTLLHKSICHIVQTMKENPEMLDPALADLKNVPLFLMGHSFGGGQVIRHCQIDPTYLSGVISINGDLSFRAGCLGERLDLISEGRQSLQAAQASAYIHPCMDTMDQDEKIARIACPILLIHSYTDCNVSYWVSKTFFERCQKFGKGDLVSLVAWSRDNDVTTMSADYNWGHQTPLNIFQKTSIDFIKSPQTFQKTQGLELEKKRYRIDMYALKHFRGASWQEQFLSECYRVFDQKKSHPPLTIAKTYAPLLRAFIYTYQLKGIQEIVKTWNFPPETIRPWIHRCALPYFEFLRLSEYIPIPYQKRYYSPLLSSAFKRWVQQDFGDDIQLYLLKNYYMANPQQVPSQFFIKDFEKMSEAFQQNFMLMTPSLLQEKTQSA